MANHNQTYKGQTNIQTPEPNGYPTPLFPARPPVLTQISNSCRKHGINLAVKWLKWQKETSY